MTVFEWLEQPWPPHGTVLNRLAELVHANGGFGILEENVQSTGRRGLNHEEALELANMNGILKGFALARGRLFDYTDIVLYIRREIARIEAEKKAAPKDR